MSAIYLIRHGQASFGAADYDQLSKLGHEQASVLGASLQARLPSVPRIVCGSMKRHRQTAEACLSAMNRPVEWTEDADCNEYDHTEIVDRFMDRQAWGAALNAAKDRGQAFEELFRQGMTRWQNGDHDAEYAQPWPAFRERCLRAVDKVAASLEPSETALVFTSGGVITAVAQSLLDFPLARFPAINWRIANCGITKLVRGSSGLFLSTLNDHAHFEGTSARLLTYR
ncbi:MAG: histidine phosphatase family protein [Panacagrimonas sp.]